MMPNHHDPKQLNRIERKIDAIFKLLKEKPNLQPEIDKINELTANSKAEQTKLQDAVDTAKGSQS